MIDSTTPVAVYPPDRVPGCLPRKSRPGEMCPMLGERIKVIPSGEWASAAKELGDSVRKKVPVILNQGSNGSCAAEAAVGAVMNARAIAGLPFVMLNPLFVYYHTSGGRDNGSSIDENLAFIRKNGIAPESVWPRSKGFRAKPSEEAYEAAKEFKIEEFLDIANVNELVSALLCGFPTEFGAEGHAILGIEHRGTKPLIQNSWDRTWGDGGFGYWVSYNAINWQYGSWCIRLPGMNWKNGLALPV